MAMAASLGGELGEHEHFRYLRESFYLGTSDRLGDTHACQGSVPDDVDWIHDLRKVARGQLQPFRLLLTSDDNLNLRFP